MEAIPHNLCPHTTSRSEFGNLFKQIIVAVEKERKLSCERVNILPGVNRCLYITDCVGERKCYLLYSRRTRLSHMITTNANRIPTRQIISAVAEYISYDAH